MWFAFKLITVVKNLKFSKVKHKSKTQIAAHIDAKFMFMPPNSSVYYDEKLLCEYVQLITLKYILMIMSEAVCSSTTTAKGNQNPLWAAAVRMNN